MISFDNTKIAFKSKNDRELRKALWLFKMIGKPSLVKVGKVMTRFARGLNIPLKPFLKDNVFAQFCGGETIEDCAETTKVLDKHNIGTILDYSVEGKESEEDFDLGKLEILRTVETANDNDHIPFCVFKITGIARFDLLSKVNEGAELSSEEKLELERIENRINEICQRAFETGTPVFIDAEESWIQDVIDQFAEKMMSKYNKETAIVFNTVQLYRWDRLDYLKKAILEAKSNGYKYGVKLVRGAYLEKENDRAEEMAYKSPIQKDKKSTDRDYNLALELCMQNIDQLSLCAGTHNEESSLYLVQLMNEHKIKSTDKRIYFAQLYGMSDHISFNLSNSEFNVAKYVPYGPIREVIPYLIRRAEENTSIEGQTGRELSLIEKEVKRRRASRRN